MEDDKGGHSSSQKVHTMPEQQPPSPNGSRQTQVHFPPSALHVESSPSPEKTPAKVAAPRRFGRNDDVSQAGFHCIGSRLCSLSDGTLRLRANTNAVRKDTICISKHFTYLGKAGSKLLLKLKQPGNDWFKDPSKLIESQESRRRITPVILPSSRGALSHPLRIPGHRQKPRLRQNSFLPRKIQTKSSSAESV